MSEMRCAYTIFLIVTCYLLPVDILLHNASVVPPLYLRSKSVSGPFRNYRISEGRAKDHRSYNGLAWEAEGKMGTAS